MNIVCTQSLEKLMIKNCNSNSSSTTLNDSISTTQTQLYRTSYNDKWKLGCTILEYRAKNTTSKIHSYLEQILGRKKRYEFNSLHYKLMHIKLQNNYIRGEGSGKSC